MTRKSAWLSCRRAVAAARYQEGEQPAENAVDLLSEARQLTDDLESLIRRINRTNAACELQQGMSITDAIARRDAIALRRRVVTAVADAASCGADRSHGWARQLRSELRQVTDVPVPVLRAEADNLARQYRELDVRIQEANWSTELAD